MINLIWRPFQVDLQDFKRWMDNTFNERSDGFATNDTGISVFIHDETEEDINALQAAWDALNEENEATKLLRPAKLETAFINAKNAIIGINRWSDMNSVQRKIVIGLSLTYEEQDQLIELYGEI